MNNSKAANAIRVAYKRGYRAVEGNIISPIGLKMSCSPKKNSNPPYLRFSIRIGKGRGFRQAIYVHKLVGFQKFGEKSLNKGICVRHKDNNAFNNLDANILIGTCKDNMQDIPPKERSDKAAANKNKYSEEFIKMIRAEYKLGNSYRDIRRKHDVAFSVLSFYLSKTAKKTSYTYPNK